MKFAFLAHPTSLRQKNYVRAVDLMNKLVAEGEGGYQPELWRRRDEVRYAETAAVRSLTGATCAGELREFPLTAQEMMVDVAAAQRSVARAVEELAARGAELVGLGGTTSIVGGRGVVTARDAPVPVTSGNSLTAYAAHAELLRAIELLEREPTSTRVVVVGYPGSISLALARMLVEAGVPVDLVHSGRSSEAALRRHLGTAADEVSFFDDVAACVDGARFFVTATSVGDVIDEDTLSPGSVVIDVALPRDVRRSARRRWDVLTIDGGFVAADDRVMLGATLAGMSINRHLNACLAETIVLALEGRPETYSIGRDLPVAKVCEIGTIAARHGFTPFPMSSWEEPLDDDAVRRLAPFHQRSTVIDLAGPAAALDRYRRFADRLLVDHVEFNHIDLVADRARGTVVTAGGVDYLDLDACHGLAALGHHPPDVDAALVDHLSREVASVVTHVGVPRGTAELCERISSLLPGPDRPVTVTTSGEEAITVAERTARVATGRSQVLRVDVFAPRPGETAGSSPGIVALPGAVAADLATLDRSVDERTAAIIIEPFVDEVEPGAVERAKRFYQAVQALAAARGAVLICDERSTAWRAAAGLASVELGLDPDVVCLGEVLSGASVPIGAAAMRQELWESASRHVPGSPVHTTPTGRNDLASTAALAAWPRLVDPATWRNVAAQGAAIKAGLSSLVERREFPQRLSGTGLLWHLKCGAPLDGALEGMRDDLTARSPGSLRTMIRELPVQVRDAAESFAGLFEDALEQFLFDRIITKLAHDHRVLIDRTRRTPRTLLITPPLIISSEETTRFVAALDAVFEDLATFEPRVA